MQKRIEDFKIPGFIDSGVRRDGHLGFGLAERLKKALGEQHVRITDFNPRPKGRYPYLILISGSDEAGRAYQEIMETPAVRRIRTIRDRASYKLIYSVSFISNIRGVLDAAVAAHFSGPDHPSST